MLPAVSAINLPEMAKTPDRNPLEGFSIEDLSELIQENPSLRGYLAGYLAEKRLKQYLLSVPGVKSVEKIPDRASARGDFRVVYGDILLTVEAKSLSTHGFREEFIEGGYSGVVSLKSTDSRDDPDAGRTTCLPPGQFDVLAICLYSAEGEWTFCFILNEYLPRSPTNPNLLATKFRVNPDCTPCVTRRFEDLFRLS